MHKKTDYQAENFFLSQDDSSYYGKIVFFGLNNRQPVIFSKGHRNPQGLFVGNNIILSTEHGDYGGDYGGGKKTRKQKKTKKQNKTRKQRQNKQTKRISYVKNKQTRKNKK